jgi:hypothetical protein
MPATVQIGTVAYRVTATPDDWMRIEHATQRKGDYGHASHNDAVIYVNPETPPDVQRLTLWHEVLHCLNETVMGDPSWLALSGNPETLLAAEEVVVRMWEHPTLAVLRDNPELVAYLTA